MILKFQLEIDRKWNSVLNTRIIVDVIAVTTAVQGRISKLKFTTWSFPQDFVLCLMLLSCLILEILSPNEKDDMGLSAFTVTVIQFELSTLGLSTVNPPWLLPTYKWGVSDWFKSYAYQITAFNNAWSSSLETFKSFEELNFLRKICLTLGRQIRIYLKNCIKYL